MYRMQVVFVPSELVFPLLPWDADIPPKTAKFSRPDRPGQRNRDAMTFSLFFTIPKCIAGRTNGCVMRFSSFCYTLRKTSVVVL
jgi:hypothetical protein